ncbi:MAG: type I methionyl aminopeptidase [Chitinophagaceae bacterium]|nr:type I methionyl aminopeptidase [Chitinophagaceae bacterium]MCW5929395.1 type I methionyl aminopeptidase [Chitinophagaceae bacterium]
MSISQVSELEGMKKVSSVVSTTLKKMREYVCPGMSTLELDDYGASLLNRMGAKSAPKLTYNFPGWTCISVNEEIAHGVPSGNKILQEGDLVNIDVSAELDGFWSDNGGSFVLGRDLYHHQPLVEVSKKILFNAIRQIKGGVKISETGRLIEFQTKRAGFRVIKNLTGHGIGRSLHEEPGEIACYYDRYNLTRFRKNSVVAIETFIATQSTMAVTQKDGWTLKGQHGGFVAQHEHTIVITDDEPIILTLENEIWN